MRYNFSAFLQCNSINSQENLISFYKEGSESRGRIDPVGNPHGSI